MPPSTACKFGDVVLVPFPFTDQVGTKKRPAVIVSSQEYNGAPQVNTLGWINSWQRLALVFLMALLIAGGALRLAWLWGRSRFLRIFIRNYAPQSKPIDANLAGAALEAQAALLYTKRQRQESDAALRARIDQLRKTLGKKYAGRETDIR